ncbi:vesicle-associated membrane protein 4, partial [Elysia marginata]
MGKCCEHPYSINSESWGPRVNTRSLQSDTKLNQLQGQVDDVVDIMKNNVNKVIERGDRLEDLQDKS